MLISVSFLRSLLLTSTFSFALPVVVLGLVLVSLSLARWVPWVGAIATLVIHHVLGFLTVFGSGDAFQGVVVIGLTCGLVGAMFDTYAFYRHHDFRNQ